MDNLTIQAFDEEEDTVNRILEDPSALRHSTFTHIDGGLELIVPPEDFEELLAHLEREGRVGQTMASEISQLIGNNPGALGPSLTYANPPEGGMPPNSPPDTVFTQDQMAFSMQTCNHVEMDPGIIEEVESIAANASDNGVAVVTGDKVIDNQVLVEISGDAVGTLPPWARYPEIFNIDLNAAGIPEADVVDMPEIDYEGEQRMLAANRGVSALYAEKHRQGIKLTAREIGITGGNLFSSNPKLSKGGRLCYISPGLMLAPWGVSGVANLCPYASKGCAFGCLNVSGQAESAKTPLEARKRRTILFYNNREEFTKLIPRAMKSWKRLADMNPADWSKTVKNNLGYSPEDACSVHDMCIRMNTLSDLRWETMALPFPEGRMTVMQRYSEYQFYDYTKIPQRMFRFINFMNGQNVSWPENYYLTFSWSEINANVAFEVLNAGGNVAVPFDINPAKKPKGDLPPVWCGYPVIDADKHDLRFIDNEEHADLREKFGTGLVCGLRIKGVAHRKRVQQLKEEERAQNLAPTSLTGGFIQHADDAGMVDPHTYEESANITLQPGYKDELIALAAQRAKEQADDPDGWMGKGFRGS